MKFWDASALLPLFVEEPTTPVMRKICQTDREILVWWGSRIECVSAIARLERMEGLTAATSSKAIAGMQPLMDAAVEVPPSEVLRDLACRLLRVHPLRADDSLQLAAALVACEHETATLEFVCLDERLRVAADREGLRVLPAAE